MIHTPLCDALGIEKPVFQGGMAWIADASLASAVSKAGGLGIIAAMNANAEWVRGQIHELRAAADNKVVPGVASVGLARLMQRAGATAVVAEGTESGGHIGETSTMALVPQVVDAVDIPVIAAGGIADGRGVAAAFMLGAQGVQVGTRFLVADECTVSDEYKDRVLKAKDISTVATGRKFGHPVRCLKTPFSNEYARLEKEGASEQELNELGTGALRKAAKEGDYEHGSFLCGQIAGMVTKREPAAAIVDDLMDGAERVLKEATKWVR